MFALILVDIQNDYFPGGAMPLVGMEAASENATRVLQFARQKSCPVIHIQHVSVREGSNFFLPDTKGVEIHSSVRPLANETLFIKHYPNSFRETGLLSHLSKLGIKELVFCGAMTHMCIDTTVRAAFDYGFQSKVVSDACATRDLEFGGKLAPAELVQTAYLAAIDYVFAEVVSAQALLS